MRIRRAEAADVDGMIASYESVAAEGRFIGGELPIDDAAVRARWLERMNDPTEALFVAEAGGAIVGMAGVRGTEIADLGMHVIEGWRGRGVGSGLLRAVIDWARAAGAHKLALQVWPHNAAAIRLYAGFGFEQEGYLRRHWRRKNGELWDAVIMGLPIPENEAPAALEEPPGSR